MTLTSGSFFSGLGCFDLALERAGWRPLWLCDSDAECQRVLAHHWPDVPVYDDVRTIDGATLPVPGLVVGGSPCTDWSVAGKRAGLAGERTGLFFDFIRLADEIAPRWVLFENVPGLLSACSCPECRDRRGRGKGTIPEHRGEDFATVLECFTGFRPALPERGWRNAGVCWGPKRSAAWRVLDAQFVGGCPLHVEERGRGPVPQRRRRVFLVARAGDVGGLAAPASERDAGRLRGLPVEVLFEPESLSRDFAPRRKKKPRSADAAARGDDVAGSLCAHTKRHGNAAGTQQAAEEGQLVVGSLQAHTEGSGYRMGADEAAAGQLVVEGRPAEDGGASSTEREQAACLTSRTSKRLDFDTDCFVVDEVASSCVPCVPGDHRASGNRGSEKLVVMNEIAAPLTSGSAVSDGVNRPGRRQEDDVNLVAFMELGEGHQTYQETDTAASLRTTTGGGGTKANLVVSNQPPVASGLPVAFNWQSGGDNRIGPKEDITDALHSSQTPAVAYTVNAAESCAQKDHAFESDTARSLDTTGGFATQQGGTVVAFQERGRDGGRSLECQQDLAYALTSPATTGRAHERNVAVGMVVRRLTPLETLRLQGLPDDWLDVDPPLSDSAKYRMTGNSGARPVLEWIARRIALVESGENPSEATP